MERTFLFHFPGRRRDPSAVPLLKWYAPGTAAERGGHRSGRGVMPRYFDHMPATKTKRPPDRPTALSLTVRVDALDFALAVRQCHSMGMVSCLLLVLAGARTYRSN